MVTVTLSCLYCGSGALVRDGHASNGKQNYRCHACGRRSCEHPPPISLQKTVVRRFCMQAQERSSLRGLTRTFGVSRATVSKCVI